MKPTMKELNTLLKFLSLVLACGLFSAGCHLGQPASASFASVKISGRSVGQIQQATVAVFRDDGYQAYNSSGLEWMFEKEGTQMNKVAYGNWIGGTPVWIRVRTSMVPLGPNSYRLQCHAFMVRSKGDSFFEEEVQLKNIRSGPYQELLDKVSGKLNQP
jgi:hypothetical protein